MTIRLQAPMKIRRGLIRFSEVLYCFTRVWLENTLRMKGFSLPLRIKACEQAFRKAFGS